MEKQLDTSIRFEIPAKSTFGWLLFFIYVIIKLPKW